MATPLLYPVPLGTRWPSGEAVDIAILSLSIEELAGRIGLPLVHDFEAGLGRWSGVGGRLPSGADVEFVYYLHLRDSVFMRVDKHTNYAVALEEAMAVLGLLREDFKSVSPLVA
jgi:hypothetical protein